MLRRPHCCVFLFGMLLVLMALVASVRVEFAAGATSSAVPAVHVAQARLEDGCLTCHSAASGARITRQPDTVSHTPLGDRLAAATEIPLQQTVDSYLYDLGQRILALPESGASDQEQVAQAFVQVVDATRALDKNVDSQAISGRIAAVESLLRHLENQASPYQVGRADGSPNQPAFVAVVSSAASPVAVLYQSRVVLDAGGGDAWALFNADSHLMPFEVAYAVLRRGPPEGAAALDSVWPGRLLSRDDMQSPFIYPGDNGGLSSFVSVVF